MWQRLTNPDILIYLHCSLETTRLRRQNPDFPDWLHAAEWERLRHARAHAHLSITTDTLAPADVLALALEFVSKHSF
jgi:hypothetical protein